MKKNILVFFACVFAINSIAQWSPQNGSGDVTTPIGRTGIINLDGYNGAQIRLNSTGTYYGKIGNPSSQVWSLGWGSSGTDINSVLTWTATGNVGIGTTSSPSTRLQVNGALKIDGAAGGVVGSGNGSRIEFSSGVNSSIEENWGLNLIGSDSSPIKIKNASLLVGYTSNSASWGTGGNLFVQGNVGIGTTAPGNFKLAVNGKIWGTEVQIALTNPAPDYVFEKSYALPTLEQVKSYIDQNKHLPEIPSAKEMEANGVNVGEMNMLLLKKIEELTLYTIEMNKRMNDLSTENKELKNRMNKIENK
jgi:hypothetical protein